MKSGTLEKTNAPFTAIKEQLKLKAAKDIHEKVERVEKIVTLEQGAASSRYKELYEQHMRRELMPTPPKPKGIQKLLNIIFD